MRDAAAAAAMSDPERNRWFRRRWSDGEAAVVQATRENGAASVPSVQTPVDELNLLGHDLLLQWWRERSGREAVR